MKIPKLRFKEFTDEWQEKKLGDISDIKGGKRIPKGHSLLTKDNGLPYLTVSGMKNNSYDFDEVKFVPVAIADQIKNYKISVDDIYVSVAGTLGLVGTIPKELDGANLTENANKLTNLRANRNFILQYLKSDRFSKLVKNVKTDNAQPKLAIYALQSFKMNLPEKIEQVIIAGFLTTVDEKINKLEEKKKGFEKYKKGVMQAIFSQIIRFRKPDGSNYPDWEEKKLGELVCFHRGNSLSKSDLDSAGKYLCIHYGELFTEYSEVIVDVKSRTSVENGTNSKTGDILMPTSDVTPQGLAKACSLQISGVKLGGDINILRPNHLVNSIMLSYLLNCQKKKIMEIVSGTTVRHIYAKDLSKLIFFFSNSPEEQEKIAGFLTSLDNKVKLITKELEQAKLFKKSLLQQMFV